MDLNNLVKRRKYYLTVWGTIVDKFELLLLEHGFSPKAEEGKGKFEIGNVHGEVYAYPSDSDNSLSYMLIYPTNTGKLSIKLAFNDRRTRDDFHSKIKVDKLAKVSSGPKKEADRHTIEYLFLEKQPPANMDEAGKLLLEKAKFWLPIVLS